MKAKSMGCKDILPSNHVLKMGTKQLWEEYVLEQLDVQQTSAAHRVT